MTMFVETTTDYHRNEGGEQHVRTVSETCWISVLHRLTGFGHMEWETAICFRDASTNKQIPGSPHIVRGDWRQELIDMPESELMAWFNDKINSNRTTFDAIIEILKAE